ncbi:MAG TPA: 2-amino-4-hydroxy-6-hydroxymethyldihydropteridine diphosphokinase, partial [Puia sp.]|nr:2-amino-4-hydroxy-6-hydroxymethyldihydropteridine diphosphokinase [Puia sp.]
MNRAYLLTGGNVGDRVSHLKQAAESMERYSGKIMEKSSLYETAPWGKIDQAPFLNQALLLSTSLDASALLKIILEVEEKSGRKRAEKYGPRIIDIDILFFNNEILNRPDLKIPHPQIQNRKFALQPLCEIAPGWVHPVFQKTIL